MKTWKINSIDCSNVDGNQQVVRQVNLSVICANEQQVTEVQTGVGLTLPQGENFIAYENLDEATVIAWAKEALGESKVKELEDALDAQFNQVESSDMITTPLPWIDDSKSPTAHL
jgi:hypothetical protein